MDIPLSEATEVRLRKRAAAIGLDVRSCAARLLENLSAGPTSDTDSVWQKLEPHVWVDPQRLGGKPCFRGTRVPVKILFDHLRAGDPLEVFLDGFPPVTREQAVAVIELAEKGLLNELQIP